MAVSCRLSANVISDTLEGDTIVIDITTGAYYTLTADAARVWHTVAAAGTLGPDATGPDLALLCCLVDEGLLEASGIPDGSTAAPAQSAFTRYTDMEELLLVDPIHEVDNEGWPVFKRVDE